MNRVIFMRNEQGFTLVEVVLSVAILFIVALAMMQFFVFSQKTTVANQDKLVATNIAQTVFERVKGGAYIFDNTFPKEYSKDSCSPGDTACLNGYIVHINNKDYFIVIRVDEEYDMRLHFVDVWVRDEKDNDLGHVRGLIEI